MPYKPTSASSEPKHRNTGGLSGDNDHQQDSLRDTRGGARDNVVPAPEPGGVEHASEHQKRQRDADVRPQTDYVDDFTPEGLTRERKGPINPHDGRGGVPAHVPQPGKHR
jgi:hypothetical protein